MTLSCFDLARSPSAARHRYMPLYADTAASSPIWPPVP